MALLCPTCHARVTRRLLSKEKEIAARLSPWCIEHGFAHSALDLAAGEVGIYVGNNYITASNILVAIRDRPIIWLEDPERPGAPKRLNALFQDKQGRELARIVRNELRTPVQDLDIRTVGPRLSISMPGAPPLLELQREGGTAVRIMGADLHYAGVHVSVDRVGRMRLHEGSDIQVFEQCQFRGGWAAINVSAPFHDCQRSRYLSIQAGVRGTPIKAIDGTYLGHCIDDLIVSRDGCVLGYVAYQGRVYRVETHEYVGVLIGEEIVAVEEFDPSGFPVPVHSQALQAQLFGNRLFPNTGWRLFLPLPGIRLVSSSQVR